MGRALGIRSTTSLLALLVAAVVVAVAVGCSPADDGERTVKIGVHTSLTGGLADVGFAAAEALKLAAEDFSGFEVDGVAYDIELIIRDDEGDPSLAPVVAQDLIDAGVIGVIGALTSGSTNAALPLYEFQGIPLISGSSTAADITEAGFENFFRTCLRDDLQGLALAEWIVELGHREVVVIDDGSDYAAGLADEVQTQLEAMALEVVRLVAEEGAADFSEQVSAVESVAPDVVVFTGYHREAAILRNQLVRAGMGDVPLMGGDGVKSDAIAAGPGGPEDVQGMMATFAGLSPEQMPRHEEFAGRFVEATGKDPGPYAVNNYDALGALVRAIVAAQSFEGRDIVEALFNIEYEGVMGQLGFDGKGDLVMAEYVGADLIPRFRFEGTNWVLLE